MTAEQEYVLLPWEQIISQSKSEQTAKRLEGLCFLWSCSALGTVMFAALTFYLLDIYPAPVTSPLVSQAEANVFEAAVTPSQVDMRISAVVGELESRLSALETYTLLVTSEKKPLLNWDTVSGFSLPAFDTPLPAQGVDPERQLSEELDPSAKIQVISRFVKTFPVNSMPAVIFPLPVDQPLP
jgi:hypothetical protein